MYRPPPLRAAAAVVPNGRDYAVRHDPPTLLSTTRQLKMVAALIIANVVVVIVVYFFSFVFLRRRAKKKSLLFCCVPSRNWRSRRNVVVIRTYTVFLSTYSDPKRSVAWPCIVSLFLFSSHTHSIFFSLASKRQLLGNSLQGCNHLLEWVRCSQISRKHPWRRKIARLLYILKKRKDEKGS
jgi:hypothetical protein